MYGMFGNPTPLLTRRVAIDSCGTLEEDLFYRNHWEAANVLSHKKMCDKARRGEVKMAVGGELITGAKLQAYLKCSELSPEEVATAELIRDTYRCEAPEDDVLEVYRMPDGRFKLLIHHLFYTTLLLTYPPRAEAVIETTEFILDYEPSEADIERIVASLRKYANNTSIDEGKIRFMIELIIKGGSIF